MKREDILQAWLKAESVKTEDTIVQFAAVIAGMQREADLSFINREGRKLPAACQQKAVQHVIAKVMDEGLVTE